MSDLVSALLLGLTEGITEFLPVSSTGHLLIAEHWLGARSELFNIAIQAGAILAVVAIYRRRLWDLLLGFLGHRSPASHDPAGIALGAAQARAYAWKLLLSFAVTAAGGLLVKKLGWELPETVRPVAWALIVGAAWMLVAEQLAAMRAAREGERTAVSWTTAILVGIAQVVAGVFRGTSRSAATIFVALLAGTTSRAAATGYELLELAKNGGIGHEDWNALAIAFVVSTITAFVAVKWLLRYIQGHRFTVFAVYRLALGAALLLWLPTTA
jgi:undecaprenyl-diphosphatase